jgi:hypothetical protein
MKRSDNMSEKKFSPEEVVKILRACNTPGVLCKECPAFHGCNFNNALLAADTIEELLGQVRWIPVGERLPDLDDGAVLIDGELTAVRVLAVIKGAKQPTELCFDGEDFFDYTGDEIITYRVTHWRPMPEVPGEEG